MARCGSRVRPMRGGSNIHAAADRRAGSKGLLIDTFDALDQECSRELYEQLNANRRTRDDNEGEIASRYGLQKKSGNSTEIPSGLCCASGFLTSPRARSDRHSRCWGSTRRSNPMSG